jgi:hypothetical protein
MSLQLIAKEMEAKGRKGDSMLVHMTPGEVAGLQKLAETAGGTLTVNPDTGLVEANFLKQMLPTLVGAGVGFMTMNPMYGSMAGAAVGGYQARRSGRDVGEGIFMGGLGGYGGATLGSSLQAAGAPATVGTQAAQQAGAGNSVANNIATNAVLGQALSGQPTPPIQNPFFVDPAQAQQAAARIAQSAGPTPTNIAGTGALAPQVPTNVQAPSMVPAEAPTKFSELSYGDRFKRGLGGVEAMGTEEGRDKAYRAMGGSEGVMRMLMMAGLPALYGARTQARSPYPLLSADVNKRGFAEGGVVANRPYIIDPATGNVIRNPNLPPPAAATFANMVGSDGGGGGGGITPTPGFTTPEEQRAYYAENPNQANIAGIGQTLFGMTPLGMMQNAIAPDFVAAQRALTEQAPAPVVDRTVAIDSPLGMGLGATDFGAPSGISLGTPGASLADAKAYAENQRQLNEAMAAQVRANIGMPTVGGPAPAANLEGMSIDGDDSRDIGYEDRNTQTAEANAQAAASQQSSEQDSESDNAAGGLLGLAKGGMRSGGFVVPADVVSMIGEGNTDAGYKRIKSMVPSATAIKGKDGGQSDTVKTSIEGKQRARVAHGEMYIPPETVKRLGGAKKLYAMMDRVRQQATGSKKQIKPVSLKRAMA